MPVYLYPKGDDYLDPKEVVSRIAQSLPIVLVDWMRGNQIIEKSLQDLIAINAPEPILISHKSLLIKTAYLRLSFPQFPNQNVEVLVSPCSRLELKCGNQDSEEAICHAAIQLASVLDYNYQVNEG